jgi:hypothetical protein
MPSHENAVLYICVENCANNFADSSEGGGGKVGGGGGGCRAKNHQELAESNTQVSIIMVGLMALPTIRAN